MKGIPRRKTLTLGDLIVSVYDVCGKQRAKGIIRLALNSHLIAFLGQRHFIVS
ncbi:MAG TPA: hypothetical protein VNT99_19525 [Methylomirabilota bacterium]|nr:hypothetical protein [Methylomirabilota bacterium]